MKIDINVKRKYKINGREYNSLDEMPEDVRDAFRKALDSRGAPGAGAELSSARTRIIFNGTEYGSIGEMPEVIRKLYERAMRAAEGETDQSAADGSESGGMLKKTVVHGEISRGPVHSQPRFESSFSPRALIAAILAAAAIFLLYLLYKGR